jgi:hypothetical protein
MNAPTRIFHTVNGPVARVPLVLADRKRSLRRLRKVIGRKPVALDSGKGFAVYAAPDSLAAAVHFRRLARFVA